MKWGARWLRLLVLGFLCCEVAAVEGFDLQLDDDKQNDDGLGPLVGVLENATRMEVVSGQVLADKNEDGVIVEEHDALLFEVMDVSEINKVISYINIHPIESGLRCLCGGHPILHFYHGTNKLAIVGYHHGRSLRWDDGPWPGDALLTEDSAVSLNDWLADHGVSYPKEEWEERERDKEIERRANAAIPSFLFSFFEGKQWEDFSEKETRKMNDLLVAEYADLNERILFLLEWFGVGGGSWSPGYTSDKAAGNLLGLYEWNEVARAIQDVELSKEQTEGLARICALNFERLIPAELESYLLEYGLKSSDRSKRIDARNAFGEFESKEAFNKESWSTINTVVKYHGTNTTVLFPDYIEGVPVAAVSGWALDENVTRVVLPATITDFSDCFSHPLEAIDVRSDHPVYSSVDGVLFNKDQSKLLRYPPGRKGAPALPSSVTVIGPSAFEGCDLLKDIHIPDGVTFIENNAFRGCVAATHITLPESVVRIGEHAFAECRGLTEQTIPRQVKHLLEGLFLECVNLERVELPPGLLDIGGDAFSDCEKLAHIEIPGSVTHIDYGAFWRCGSLREIEISAAVRFVDGAFIHCRQLQAIKVHPKNPNYRDVDGVLLTKDGTTLVQFPGGRKGEVILPSGILHVQYDAFGSSEGITSVKFMEGVTNIAARAFMGCSGLVSVTLPAECAEIGGEVFKNCSALTEITIPENVKMIYEGVFEGCSSLEKVYFEGDKPVMEVVTFGGSKPTLYYRADREGWGADEIAGRPTALWRE